MSRFNKGLFAVAGMSLCVCGTALANDLTVVSWGGAYTMSQVEAYHKPWMAKTGKTIVSEDYSGGIAEIKAQVESGNVTWDIVDVELSDALRACRPAVSWSRSNLFIFVNSSSFSVRKEESLLSSSELSTFKLADCRCASASSFVDDF